MRSILPVLGSALVLGGLAAAGSIAGCGVGSTTDFSDGGADGTGSGKDASAGNGFATGNGNGSTGAGQACTAPNCIGNTPQGNCDSGLAIDSATGIDGAKAIGICQVYSNGTWGIKEASWVRSDGQPLDGLLTVGKGILPNFGSIAPREGASMLAISSGNARAVGQPDYYPPGEGGGGGDWKDFNPHGAPAGYPKEAPSCAGIQTQPTGEPYDSAGLKVVVHTPADAKSLSFNVDFYTYEFPVYICSEFNDFFVALMNPRPAGATDDNISFDSMGNNISVNAGFLQVCSPQNAGGKQYDCPLGTGELSGTGFDDATAPGNSAATSWLETTAPVTPDSDITLQFSIWDSGDGQLDSTALIDNFKFQLTDAQTGTTPIPQ